MNIIKTISLFTVAVACVSAFAEGEQEERLMFRKWHIGIGAAFNSGVKADISTRNLPVPRQIALPYSSSRDKAQQDSANRRWRDGAAFIADDNGYETDTENWRLPVDAYNSSATTFTLENRYEEVIGSSFSQENHDGSATRNQFGIGLELSRELWIHDENEDHRWGLDFAAGFSYFFRRDLYSAHGTVTRNDLINNGSFVTTVNDPSAMWDYDHGGDTPVGGMYGCGTGDGYVRCGSNPALRWDAISGPTEGSSGTSRRSSSLAYTANGDYQELEMLFMLRPWYELKDWWRIYGQVGLGVSWGRFDTTVTTQSYSRDEAFDQWDVYGVAGLGTMFRYKRYTLAVDFLGRFLRDDLDVNGQNLHGSIQRADWGIRLMVGYEF